MRIKSRKRVRSKPRSIAQRHERVSHPLIVPETPSRGSSFVPSNGTWSLSACSKPPEKSLFRPRSGFLVPCTLLRPPHHLRFPNPLPLPHLRRLCHLRPLLCLPTQSAFIRVIRLIRDSDSFPRQHGRDVFRQRKAVFPLKVRDASALETKHGGDVHTHVGGGQVCFGFFPFAQM